jgi:hypothetical protein
MPGVRYTYIVKGISGSNEDDYRKINSMKSTTIEFIGKWKLALLLLP